MIQDYFASLVLYQHTSGMFDQITRIRVRGMKSVRDVVLPLSGLTVLFGDSGTGKSTLLQALELLTRCPRQGTSRIAAELAVLGGADLFRDASERLALDVHIEGRGAPLDYGFSLKRKGESAIVASEYLVVHNDPPEHVVLRSPTVADDELGLMAHHALDIAQGSSTPPPTRGFIGPPARTYDHHVDRVIRVLARATHRLPRESMGDVYRTIRDTMPRDGWERVQENLSIGLDVVGVWLTQGDLLLDFLGCPSRRLSATSLSDGQLAYLSIVALAAGQYSLVGLDDPMQHIYANLSVRALWLFEEFAKTCPVVITTHSDRVLDALTDPLNTAVMCKLNERRETVLCKANKELIEPWLTDYNGIGSIRAEYGLSQLFTAL